MRKIVLTMMVAASILWTSCKENTKKDVNNEVTKIGNDIEKGADDLGNNIKEGYNKAKKSIEGAFDDIKIPKLDDEKAETHLERYAAFVKEQMDKGAENIKNSEFTMKTKEFAKESEQYMENLGTEAKASFKATMTKIDAKAKEIEKDLKE
jgi:predicted small secreted protein